jgi:hypothetical protein
MDPLSKVCLKKATYLISYDFNSSQETFIDQTNGLVALKGAHLGSDGADPLWVYNRGLWFGGSAIVSLPPNEADSAEFALPSKFTASFWAKLQVISEGTVLGILVRPNQNQLDDGSSFSSVSVSQRKVVLTSASSQVSQDANGTLYADVWTHIAFSFDYLGLKESCLALNFNFICTPLEELQAPVQSKVVIGCKSTDMLDCFKGFVWSLRVHDESLSQAFVLSQVTGKAYAVSPSACSFFPRDLNHCISECQVHEFGAKCEGCASNCTNGCRRATDCSLCGDNCEEWDYDKCLRCSKGFVLRDSACQACQANCKACSTWDKCTECADAALALLKDSVLSCVASCPEGYYPQERECLACRPECKTCTDGNYCSTCKEDYYAYDEQSPLECLVKCPTNFIGFNGECKRPCTIDSLNCFDCNQICSTCKHCQQCRGSVSASKGYCDCSSEMVYPKDSCRTKVALDLLDNNIVVLRLLKKPVRRLIAADLHVEFNTHRRLQTTSWKLLPTDIDTLYYLKADQNFDNITLQVDFALTSIEGYPYSDLPFSSGPVESSSSSEDSIELFSAALISGALTVLVGGISVFSGETSSLLSMIMTIQLASYIPLANERMPANLRERLVGTNQINNIPGFLDSLLEDDGLNNAHDSVKKYGFRHTSFIYNAYMELLIILVVLVFLLILGTVSIAFKSTRKLISKLKVKHQRKIQFKLSCFLCLDLLVKSVIQLESPSISTVQEAIGMCLAAVSIIYFVGYAIYLVFVYCRHRGLLRENSDANFRLSFLVEGLMSSGRGVSYWLMLIVHRLLFVLFLIVPDDPQLQLTAIFVLNIMVIYRKALLFLAVVRPMHSMMLNGLAIIAEICLSLVMCMVLLNYLDDAIVSTYTVLVCLACCACIFFTCHLAVAIIRAVKRIREARRKSSEAKVVPDKIGISMGEIDCTTVFDPSHPQIDRSSNCEDFSPEPERLVVSEQDVISSVEINDSDIYINSSEEDAEAAVEVYSSHSLFDFQGELEIERQSKKLFERLEVRRR